jgi:DNA primase
MHFSSTFIRRLVAHADLVRVVANYVQLKPAGNGFKGLCPFHPDRSPSFRVQVSNRYYQCHGCSARGNALQFLIQHEGLGLAQAIQRLAELEGVSFQWPFGVLYTRHLVVQPPRMAHSANRLQTTWNMSVETLATSCRQRIEKNTQDRALDPNAEA